MFAGRGHDGPDQVHRLDAEFGGHRGAERAGKAEAEVGAVQEPGQQFLERAEGVAAVGNAGRVDDGAVGA